MFINKKYILAFLVLFLISCGAGQGSISGGNQSASHSGGNQSASQFQAALSFANSTSALENFLNTSYHAAKNSKIHLELVDSGFLSPEKLSTYMGLIEISFTEGFSSGQQQSRQFTFTTGDTKNKTKYNYLYVDKTTDQFVWKGFFQNDYGSVIVILTEGQAVTDDLSTQDGLKTQVLFSLANGYVYARIWNNNTNYTRGALTSKKCWELWGGPYDCRSWKAGKGMDITKAVFPDGSEQIDRRGKSIYGKYVKLGQFADINLNILFKVPASQIPVPVVKKIKKSPYLMARANKNKSSRGLASTYRSQNLGLFPKILLIALALTFISLVVLVFRKTKKNLK